MSWINNFFFMNNDKAKIDELGKNLTKIDGSKVFGGSRFAKNELSNNTKKSNWVGSCGSIIPQ